MASWSVCVHGSQQTACRISRYAFSSSFSLYRKMFQYCLAWIDLSCLPRFLLFLSLIFSLIFSPLLLDNVHVATYAYYHWCYTLLTYLLVSRVCPVCVGVATCTPACTELAADATSSASRGPTPCLHGQLHRHQELIERGLRPVLSHPYSTHQLATVNALTEANNALVKCRGTLKWIYGKNYVPSLF